MGFDLVAKRNRPGRAGYYGSRIEFMAFLRSTMLAAGVPETLIYTKFVSNDSRLVTERQSQMIAERLTAWLRGRNLVVDLAEPKARPVAASLRALELVHRSVGNRKEADRLARRSRAKSLPFRVDRKARTAIRDFAAFCAGSRGFYVS